MELSLQKKINLRLIRLLRTSMIEEAGLHIEDKVTYKQFLELYEKYGNGFDKDVFARYFLDIEGTKLYYLSIRKSNRNTHIKKRICIRTRIR